MSGSGRYAGARAGRRGRDPQPDPSELEKFGEYREQLKSEPKK